MTYTRIIAKISAIKILAMIMINRRTGEKCSDRTVLSSTRDRWRNDFPGFSLSMAYLALLLVHRISRDYATDVSMPILAKTTENIN
jgi:hypothetical protein